MTERAARALSAVTRAEDAPSVVHAMHVYGARRGADHFIDQLSRSLHRGVRATMQRIVVEEPNEAAIQPAASPPEPAIDIRAIICGRCAK